MTVMRKKDRPPLGLRLTELRQAAGLTQNAVGRKHRRSSVQHRILGTERHAATRRSAAEARARPGRERGRTAWRHTAQAEEAGGQRPVAVGVRVGVQAAASPAGESRRSSSRHWSRNVPTARLPELFFLAASAAVLFEERSDEFPRSPRAQLTFHYQNLARAGGAVPWSVSDTHRFPRARGSHQARTNCRQGATPDYPQRWIARRHPDCAKRSAARHGSQSAYKAGQ